MGVILSEQAEIYHNNGSCAELPAYVGLLDGFAVRLRGRGVDMFDAQFNIHPLESKLGYYSSGCQGG